MLERDKIIVKKLIKYCDIPWAEMKGMRNIHAHELLMLI